MTLDWRWDRMRRKDREREFAACLGALCGDCHTRPRNYADWLCRLCRRDQSSWNRQEYERIRENLIMSEIKIEIVDKSDMPTSTRCQTSKWNPALDAAATLDNGQIIKLPRDSSEQAHSDAMALRKVIGDRGLPLKVKKRRSDLYIVPVQNDE